MGYINKEGEIVIRPMFRHSNWISSGYFKEGLAAVRNFSYDCDHNCGKWGYIDKSGKLVIDYKFDKVNAFNNGYARIMYNGKTGYVDKKGIWVWKPTK